VKNNNNNKRIGEKFAHELAEELCSVQPIHNVDLRAAADALDLVRAASGHKCCDDPLHNYAKQE
jgi:hypothetical protein